MRTLWDYRSTRKRSFFSPTRFWAPFVATTSPESSCFRAHTFRRSDPGIVSYEVFGRSKRDLVFETSSMSSVGPPPIVFAVQNFLVSQTT